MCYVCKMCIVQIRRLQTQISTANFFLNPNLCRASLLKYSDADNSKPLMLFCVALLQEVVDRERRWRKCSRNVSIEEPSFREVVERAEVLEKWHGSKNGIDRKINSKRSLNVRWTLARVRIENFAILFDSIRTLKNVVSLVATDLTGSKSAIRNSFCKYKKQASIAQNGKRNLKMHFPLRILVSKNCSWEQI